MDLDPSLILLNLVMVIPMFKSCLGFSVLHPQSGPYTQPYPGPRKWDTFAGTPSNVLSIYPLFRHYVLESLDLYRFVPFPIS